MWKKTGDFKNRPENTLIFENCIPDDSSSEAFSVFCLNTSTDSSFELTSVDPLNNLKIASCELQLETVRVKF